MQGTLNGISSVDVFSLLGLLHVLQQLVVGLMLGFVFQLVMSAITLAGHNVATTMGLGFAATADPHNGSESTTIGQIYTVIATLYFLSVDAHLHLLGILSDSMKSIPLQQFVLDSDFFRALVQFSGQVFVFGTLLVLPVIIGLLLVNLALAVMTRAAPQLNIFSLGFPVTIIAGFVLMLLSVPVLSPLLGSFMDVTLAFMRDLSRGLDG